MKINKSGVFYLFLILLNWSCYSSKNLSIHEKGETEIVDFQVDKLGNYYTLSSEGVLNKYNDSQKSLYSYSNSIYGIATMVDASNPHKILLFFKNHQRIILLDNTLSEIGTLQLNSSTRWGLSEVEETTNQEEYFTAVGLSSDNNIWGYDSYTMRLKKLNDKGNTLEESLPITNINPKTIKKSKIYDFGQKLLINDEEKGILLFDNLGYYEKTIKLQNVNNPLLSKDNLIYFDDKDKMIKAYDIRLNQDLTVFDNQKLNLENATTALYRREKIYIVIGQKVKILRNTGLGF